MPDAKALLVEELVRLRHGWGLEAVNLHDRIGPHLAELAEISPDDPDRTIRRKISTFVRRISEELPDEDRLAIAVALGSEQGLQHSRLNQRMQILAERLHCAERTARRRVDRATERLAEAAIALAQETGTDVDDPDKGWFVRRFDALLRLDTPTPELIEEREIVASRDNLKKISARVSLPPRLDGGPGAQQMQADMQFGALIEAHERQGEAHFRYLLDLPRMLRRGERHTYRMVIRVPDGHPIRDHYAFVPLVRCESFGVRVRFDPQRPPRAVWRLDHLAPRMLDDRSTPGRPLELDDAFEVVQEFERPELGFGYGVGWLPG
jgi:hypothetical protein